MYQRSIARATYLALAALSLLVFVAVIFHYRDASLATSRAILVYGGPALGLIILLAASLRPPRIPVEIALFLLAVGIGLLGVEVGLRLLTPATGESRFAGIRIPPGSSQIEVVRLLRNRGLDAYPAVFPGLFLRGHELPDHAPVRPLSGIANVPSVLCDERAPGFIVYQSDRHGFRNPDEIWDVDLDLALIGDSFAEGLCVPWGHTIPGQMNEHGWSGVTLGMPGNGALLELATVREYLGHTETRQPPVVIWMYYEGNDLWDLHVEKADSILPLYLDPSYSQSLIDQQERLDSLLIGYVEALWRERVPPPSPVFAEVILLSELRTRLEALAHSLTGHDEADPGGWLDKKPEAKYREFAPDTALFRDVLHQARDEIRAWGGQLVFLYLPQWERYGDPSHADARRDDMLEIVSDLGLPIVDMHPVFAAHPDPRGLYTVPNARGHFTPEGYALVAETVIAWLENQGLLPGPN